MHCGRFAPSCVKQKVSHSLQVGGWWLARVCRAECLKQMPGKIPKNHRNHPPHGESFVMCFNLWLFPQRCPISRDLQGPTEIPKGRNPKKTERILHVIHSSQTRGSQKKIEKATSKKKWSPLRILELWRSPLQSSELSGALKSSFRAFRGHFEPSEALKPLLEASPSFKLFGAWKFSFGLFHFFKFFIWQFSELRIFS